MQVSRVLPMSLDYSVTYVSGLYRPPPNVRWSCRAVYGCSLRSHLLNPPAAQLRALGHIHGVNVTKVIRSNQIPKVGEACCTLNRPIS